MKYFRFLIFYLSVTAPLLADTFEIPPLSESFAVRVTLLNPTEQYRIRPLVPLAIRQPLPEYPIQQRGERIVGEVWVSFTVEADGTMTRLRVLKESQSEFREPTLAAVRNWRFSPAKDGTKSVAMTLEYAIRYLLPRD